MYQNYPTGFRSPLGLGKKYETSVDSELAEFLSKLNNNEYRIDSWSTRDKLFRITKRLFGNFAEWVIAQDKNDAISQNAYEMIADTISFINKGRRPVALSSRRAIITMEVADGVYRNEVAARRTTTLLDSIDFPAAEYLYRWVNQPDGFGDMLCTVRFIFGSELR